MTDEFRRLQEAFHRARAEPDPAARERILLAAAGDDQRLLAELRAMLAADLPDAFLEMQGPPPPPLLGEFELRYELASGGSGVVWVAHQPSLARDVAVKVMTAGPGTPAAQIQRFHREPLAASRLDHPHIVPVYAEGTVEHTHWFAMQLVHGHSLAREIELQREHAAGALLPPHGTGAWFAAIAGKLADAADALQAAHDAGIVHRDVKPPNLLLDRRGNLLVADFGIARDERFGSLTDPGTIAGSWHYMSPEQARVLRTPVDQRTDIYSLGVVLYELLTLERPFEGETSHQIVEQIRRTLPRPVRQLCRGAPRDLETICMAAMARSPDARYRTAAALRDDLRRFVAHEAILQQPPTALARAGQWLHRRRRAVAALAMVLVAIAGTVWMTDEIHAASARATLADRCAAVLQGDLATVPETELATLWRDLRSAPAEVGATAADARRRIGDHRRDLETAAADSLRAATADTDDARRHALVVEAMRLVWRARAIDPEAVLPPEFAGDPFLATVDVAVLGPDDQPLAATVGVRFVDPMTTLPADEQALGTAPIHGSRLRDGLHRIVVHSAFGTQEFPCLLQLLERRTLALRVAALADPAADMVRIRAGTLQIEANGPPSGLAGRRVEVPEFWLDRCEVTVADYLEFARATGRQPPFGLGQPPADKLRWPVVNVTWDDAVAYAAFRGKRLPTHAEWMLAARGPGPAPRRYPWLDAGLHGNCRVEKDHRGWAPEEVIAAFWRHAVAVDSTPDSASPEGVLELFGNVEEWTESLGVEKGLVVDPRARVACGLAWFTLSVAPGDDLRTTVLASVGSWPSAIRGFRCARSTSPP